jgi:hypothetical protein
MVNYIYLLIPPINERDFGDPMISRWHHRLSQTCPTWSCCREAKQKNGPGAWSLQPSGSHFLRYTLGNGNLRCDFQPTLRPARSQQKSAFFPRKSSSAFSRRCTSVTICGRAHVLREIEVIQSSGRSGCSGQSKALLTSLYGTISPSQRPGLRRGSRACGGPQQSSTSSPSIQNHWRMGMSSLKILKDMSLAESLLTKLLLLALACAQYSTIHSLSWRIRFPNSSHTRQVECNHWVSIAIRIQQAKRQNHWVSTCEYTVACKASKT